MFEQSADAPAPDQSPAPIGMRELPPQPARPVMPAFPMPAPPPAASRAQDGPGPDDSVIARDDHVEGTFTSRGTVVVMGSLKGRIEAVRVRIEPGARVEADVIVDEAIVAGEFSGNLTCRERLEAHASGRIDGHVETYKLMLHEGASVEGEMHMLSEAPRDASTTIRGSAPLRGEPAAEVRSEPARPAPPAPPVPASGTPTSGSGGPVPAEQTGGGAGVRPAPTVTPSSSAKTVSSPAASAQRRHPGGRHDRRPARDLSDAVHVIGDGGALIRGTRGHGTAAAQRHRRDAPPGDPARGTAGDHVGDAAGQRGEHPVGQPHRQRVTRPRIDPDGLLSRDLPPLREAPLEPARADAPAVTRLGRS